MLNSECGSLHANSTELIDGTITSVSPFATSTGCWILSNEVGLGAMPPLRNRGHLSNDGLLGCGQVAVLLSRQRSRKLATHHQSKSICSVCESCAGRWRHRRSKHGREDRGHCRIEVWQDRRADQQCGCFHSEALHRIHH